MDFSNKHGGSHRPENYQLLHQNKIIVAKDQKRREFDREVKSFVVHLLDISYDLTQAEKTWESACSSVGHTNEGREQQIGSLRFKSIQEYLAHLSGSLFQEVISFNKKLKNIDSYQVSLLKRIKPIDVFVNRAICMLTSQSFFDNTFDQTLDFDWKKKYYFCNTVEINNMWIADPYSRQRIREANRQLFRETVDNHKSILGNLSQLQDIEVVRTLLQIGLFTIEDGENILRTIKRDMQSRREQSDDSKGDLDLDERDMENDIKELAQILMKKLNKTQDFSYKILVELYSLFSGTKVPHELCYMEIVMHAIIMVLDEMVVTGKISDTKKCQDLYFGRVMKKAQTFLMKHYFTKPEVLKTAIDHPLLAERINRIMMSITSVDGDSIAKSLELFHNIKDLQTFHAMIITAPDEKSSAASSNPFDAAKPHTDELLQLNLKLIDGNYGETLSKPAVRQTLEQQKAQEPLFFKNAELLERLTDVLVAACEQNSRSVGPNEVGNAHLEGQDLVTARRHFKFSFTLRNGVYLTLNLIYALSTGYNNPETKECMQNSFLMLGELLMDNELGFSHLYRQKEWSIFTKLARFIPVESMFILLMMIKTNPWSFSFGSYGKQLVLELVTHQINAYLQPRHIEADAAKKEQYTATFLALEVLSWMVRVCKQQEDRFRNGILVADILLPFVRDVAFQLLTDEQQINTSLVNVYTPQLSGWNPELIIFQQHYPRDMREWEDSYQRLVPSFMRFEIATKVLQVYNQAALYSKRGVPEPYGFFGQNERSLATQIRKFSKVKYGLIFTKELVKLFVRTSLLEPNISKNALRTGLFENIYPDYWKDEWIRQNFKVKALEIENTVDALNRLQGDRFEESHVHFNRSYILEGLLPMCYKFLEAVHKLIPEPKVIMTDAVRVMDVIRDNQRIMSLMVSPNKRSKPSNLGMFKKFSVRTVNQEKPKNSKSDAEVIENHWDEYCLQLNEDGNTFSKISKLDAIQEFIDSIKTLYEGENDGYKPFIDGYRHEDFEPQLRAKNLHPKNTNEKVIHFPILEDLENMGCPGLKTFKNKFSSLLKASNQIREQQIAADSQHNKSNKVLPVTGSELQRTEPQKPLQKPRSSVHPKVTKIVQQMEQQFPTYISLKNSILSTPTSQFYTILEEGVDSDPDMFYHTLFDWALAYIKSRIEAPEPVWLPALHNVADSAKAPVYKSEFMVLQVAGSDNVAPRNVKDFKIEETTSPVSAELLLKLDEIFLKDRQLLPWVVCLDNLIRVKTSKTKPMFYTRYFSTDEEDDVEKEFHDTENMDQNSVLAEEDDEILSDPENNEAKLRTLDYLKHLGSTFAKYLFHGIILFQMNIKREIFNSRLKVHFKSFFTLTNLVKTLAEDNHDQFKKLIGTIELDAIQTDGAAQELKYGTASYKNLNLDHHTAKNAASAIPPLFVLQEYLEDSEFATKKPGKHKAYKGSKLFLHLFYSGIYLDRASEDQKIELTSKIYSDREDLIYYNYMCLVTLSECFNGPCKPNQKMFIVNLSPLVATLKKLESNIFHNRYLLQEAIVKLLAALFEGNSALQVEKISQLVQPEHLYQLIVRNVEHLWLNRHRLSAQKPSKKVHQNGGLSFESKPDHLSRTEAPGSSKVIIEEFYLKSAVFSSHPVIQTSNGLLYLLKTVANARPAFSKFVDEKLRDMYTIFGKEGIEIKQETIKTISRKQQEERDSGAAARDSDGDPNSQGAQHKGLVYYHFINLISKSIEVNTETEKNIIVPFLVLPMCFFLTKNSQSNFRITCDIGDTSRKLIALMNSSDEFIIEMQHNIGSYRQNYFVHLLTTNDAFTIFMQLQWMLGLIINLIILADWKYDLLEEPSTSGIGITSRLVVDRSDWSNLTVVIITLSMLGISFFQLLLWFIYKYGEVLQKHTNRSAANSQKHAKQSNQSDRELVDAKDFKVRWVSFKINIVYCLFMEIHPSCFALHMLYSGLSFLSPFAFTLHLFNIGFISETCRYVVRSITSHAKQLVFTLVTVLFIVYTYTVIISYYYKESFDLSVTNNLDFCDNLKGCLAYVLDVGLRLGGGIGEAMVVFPFETHSFAGKTFMQITFYILINLILLNIFFGIIVDTFKELRDDLQKRDEDERNVCFVCGFSRKDFEKEEKSFDFHIRYEHYIWNYVYFIAYLISKSSDDYTGNEYLLRAEKVKNDYDEIQKAIERIEKKSNDIATKIPDMSKDNPNEPVQDASKVKSDIRDLKSPKNQPQFNSEIVKVNPKNTLLFGDVAQDGVLKQPSQAAKQDSAAIAAFSQNSQTQGKGVGATSSMMREYSKLVEEKMQDLEECLQKELSAVSQSRRDQSAAYYKLLEDTEQKLYELLRAPLKFAGSS